VKVSIAWLKGRPEAYGLFVSYGPAKNLSLSPSRPERAEAVADQGTCMALMGTYVCLNGW
jgi:hypothetical protein